MPTVIIDFEEKHYQLCKELDEILVTDPIGDAFHSKVLEMDKNFQTWVKLGKPNGPVTVNLED